MFDWCYNLMKFLDEKALSGKDLTDTEIKQLNICVERYDLADSALDLIREIANAIDCGKCDTWKNLVDALRELHRTGDKTV